MNDNKLQTQAYVHRTHKQCSHSQQLELSLRSSCTLWTIHCSCQHRHIETVTKMNESKICANTLEYLTSCESSASHSDNTWHQQQCSECTYIHITEMSTPYEYDATTSISPFNIIKLQITNQYKQNTCKRKRRSVVTIIALGKSSNIQTNDS